MPMTSVKRKKPELKLLQGMATQQAHEHAEAPVFCGQRKLLSELAPKIEQTPLFDRLLHAEMLKTFGLSPAALITTWFDWATHLAFAPGRQGELVQSAFKKHALLANYVFQTLSGVEQPESCASPLPQDRRFNDKSWQEWPYTFYQQAFLLTEQWWQEATSNVRGVTRHHADVMAFLSRQWLDIFAPLNFPWLNPRVVHATAAQGGTNFINGAKNWFDDFTRNITQAPPAGAQAYTVGETIAITPGKVIYQNRLIELIQYTPTTKEVYAEPVLIIPAWIMKYYILDLSPQNSLVKYLVKQGHTVFMISWKNPDATDRDLGFEDYLNLGIMDALQAINAILPNHKVHAAGYCLGGTLLATAAATMARANDKRLKSMTLFAAQVDFEEAGELLLFIDESQLAFLEDVMWEQGYLDKKQMAGTFQMLRSYDLIWSRLVEEYMLGNRPTLNDLMAWNADATRMPYRMHSEYLRRLFLNNDLAEGRFTVDDMPIELADIQLPIFTVGTQRDHVAPWQSVYKIQFFTKSNEVVFVLTSGGHNAGIVSEPGHPHRTYQIAAHKNNQQYLSAEEWRDKTPVNQGSWWPAWCDWLSKHSGTKEKPPTFGAPARGYRILRDAPGKYVLVQ